jgi:phage terminase small subunit
MNKLTDKQRRFCEEYVIDWNGTRAAIAAGYSEKTAKQQAHQLLDKPLLSEYIAEIQTDLQKITNDSFVSQVTKLKDFMESDDITRREWLEAFKELNKMYGFYAPKKQEVNQRVEQPLFGPLDEDKKVTGFNIVISD